MICCPTIRFQRWNFVAGAALCCALAGTVSFIFRNSPSRRILPLIFLAVILFVAQRFGVSAGVVGSIVSAAIFAVCLFPPLGNLTVENMGERSNLGWMILAGV